MTNERSPARIHYSLKFSWWCRQCGWWTEVDLSGLCPDCRHESDRKRRGPTPEEREELGTCARCRT